MYRNGWSGEYNCGSGVLNSWTHIAVVIGTAAQTCYINGSLVATCTWKPSLHGQVTISASAKPTNTYVPASSSALNIVVTTRGGNR